MGGQVEDGSLISHDSGRKVERVAHAQVERQPPAEPPIFLQIELDNPGAGLDDFRLSVDAETAHLAQQERGQAVTRAGRDGSGWGEARGRDTSELKVTSGAGRLQHIQAFQTDIDASLKAVATPNSRDAVYELRYRSGEDGIAAPRWTQLLQAHHVEGGQDIGE